MQISGNHILITGGGSGIGRALAEKFHAAGNQVIIAGRNAAKLDDVMVANPGMTSMTFDVGDGDSIAAFAADLIAAHPKLNVVLNNAGIMQEEDVVENPADISVAERTIATNLLGPIRLTAALLPHLLEQPVSTVLMVSSGLAFVPKVTTPTYSATKSAIHGYAMALRAQLKDTSTDVVEIIPPYVQTFLTGASQAADPHAMPLNAYIDEVFAILTENSDVQEVIVERCKPLRFAAQNGNLDQVFAGLNAL